jgi:4-phospho-D-threonate 3-dehydrogenase / 4-phospho-D-erythronate 3-dehydrogenase
MQIDRAERPVVAITMGDAAGIGPEVVVKALALEDVRAACRCVIIGDAAFLRREAAKLDPALHIVQFDNESATPSRVNTVECDDLQNLSQPISIGQDSAEAGRAAAEYIVQAVELWRSGSVDAICTAPISKKAIALGGYNFPGHTEFLAELTNTEKFAMSFFGGDLRVVLLSTHLPLRDAIERVQHRSLVDLISFADRELARLLGRSVKLAVAGLNPHASEQGMFGGEESQEIVPAIDECRRAGIDVSGPYSPDTVFLRVYRGEFDACIALYHDQATIPVKALTFGNAVNVTLGLPLVRTSVDHGTAYDIAGQGIADAGSMAAAIKLAAELVKTSRQNASSW